APYLYHGRVYAPLAGDEPWDAIYFGAAMPALVLLLILNFPRARPERILAIAALSLALFAILAMLGRHGLVYHALTQIPVVNFFRAPARYVAVLHVALAVCCALSFSLLLRTAIAQSAASW